MNQVPLNAIPRRNAEVFGRRAALITESETMTWDELEARSNRRARLIQACGVCAGDLVTFNLPNGSEFFETTFALWKLGATPNPVSPKLPPRELNATIAAARPSLFIGDGVVEGPLRLSAGADTARFSAEPVEEVVSARWKAITSGGSTGRPKIIVDNQPAVFDVASPVREQPPGGVVLNPGPLYHNAPFLFSHHALSIGCTVVNMARFDPERALALIARHRVQWVTFVPTMMARIWRLPEDIRLQHDVSSLQTVFHMASPMPVWLKERWIEWLGAEKLWELYGGTERLGNTVIRGDDWLKHRGSVGRPVGGCQIRVFDINGAACGPDEIGEIHFLPSQGAGTTYRYLGAESHRRPDGWESLGDIGWLDKDGYLYIADRRSDLILRGGANIYPAEIECALEEHPSVASSIVVGLPDEDLGQRVHAIVQVRDGHGFDAWRLSEFLAERLAPNKLPESYEANSESLRDDAGKARRSALRDQRSALFEAGTCLPPNVVDLRSR